MQTQRSSASLGYCHQFTPLPTPFSTCINPLLHSGIITAISSYCIFSNRLSKGMQRVWGHYLNNGRQGFMPSHLPRLLHGYACFCGRECRVKGLLSLFQTAILGGSRGTYSTAYTFVHGPYEGETFIVNSGGGGGTAVNGYYNDFGGSANYGSSSYVVAIDSGGWKSYLMSGLGWMCYLCK